LKYPTIFNSSDVAIITKMDLAKAADFDLAAARRNIESGRPGTQIFEVSAKSGSGMKEVLQFLCDQLVRSRENLPAFQSECTHERSSRLRPRRRNLVHHPVFAEKA
jgi:hydrogenase nickel incorporation protein HypB